MTGTPDIQYAGDGRKLFLANWVWPVGLRVVVFNLEAGDFRAWSFDGYWPIPVGRVLHPIYGSLFDNWVLDLRQNTSPTTRERRICTLSSDGILATHSSAKESYDELFIAHNKVLLVRREGTITSWDNNRQELFATFERARYRDARIVAIRMDHVTLLSKEGKLLFLSLTYPRAKRFS
jgi:hypothetical protein